MKIAVDAMGGDRAPSEVVKGALEAAEAYGEEIILVGKEEAVRAQLEADSRYGRLRSKLHVIDAPDVIEMGDHPAAAVRKRKGASIVVAAELVSSGEADALVSMGNTGATMAASLLKIKRISRIERPAIAIPMPTINGMSLLLDAGANADSKPEHLLDFAIMGSIYMERVMKRSNPAVGLLNVGEEEEKGSEVVRRAYELFKESPLNFAGNIEGRDIPSGDVDVIVCDGFVGNIVLKFAEGLGKAIFDIMKAGMKGRIIAKLGALAMMPVFKDLKGRMDYTEYGGAPLLGINGVSIIGHGRSNSKAVRNAIRVAIESVTNNIVGSIRESISRRPADHDDTE